MQVSPLVAHLDIRPVTGYKAKSRPISNCEDLDCRILPWAQT